MWIAGLFLIVASTLKVHQLITEPIISKGFWESWEFFLIQIPLEMGLGLWLISGLFRKAGWLLGLIAYCGFIGVTLFKSLTGEASCGCFGVVKVNPWITLTAIDIPIFLLLAIFRPKGEKLLPPPWPRLAHFLAIAIPTFILLPSIEYLLITNKQAKPNVEDWVSKTSKTVITESNLPAGQAAQNIWPLLKDINIQHKLRAGVWIVLMYHYDCPDCAKAVPKYEEMYKSLQGNEGTPNFAFVEMPPYGNKDQQLISPDSKVVRGFLNNTQKWFFQTPVVVVLDNGAVLKAWEGKAPDLDELLNAAFGQ